MPAFFAAVPIGDNLLFSLNAHPRKAKKRKNQLVIDYFLLTILYCQ